MHRPTLTQYNVLLPNEPRRFARLARLLAKERIGAHSVISASAGKNVAVQLLARRDTRLRRALEKACTAVEENQIFQFEMPSHPWELHKLAKALALGRIRIISMFMTPRSGCVRVVLAVDQPANAVDLISRLGFSPDYSVL